MALTELEIKRCQKAIASFLERRRMPFFALVERDVQFQGKKKPCYQLDSRVSSCLAVLFGSSTWARTRDLRINSPALYQLSYRGISHKL